MTDAVVAFQGWNSSTVGWGDGTWGGDIALPGAAGNVGTVIVNAAANVPVTGLATVQPSGGGRGRHCHRLRGSKRACIGR
jgi:hypothetical protein